MAKNTFEMVFTLIAFNTFYDFPTILISKYPNKNTCIAVLKCRSKCTYVAENSQED